MTKYQYAIIDGSKIFYRKPARKVPQHFYCCTGFQRRRICSATSFRA